MSDDDNGAPAKPLRRRRSEAVAGGVRPGEQNQDGGKTREIYVDDEGRETDAHAYPKHPAIEIDKAKRAEETSGQLAAEIDKAKRFDFATVQRPAREKPLRPDLEKIVEEVFVNDVHELWERVKKSLRVGEKRSEHGVLQRSLDDARKISYDAHRLYVTARLEQERWERENDSVWGVMWTEATRALQHEKDQHQRSKQITDADVRAKAAVIYPDQWTAQEVKRKRLDLVVDNMKQLAKDASDHCNDLQVMLSKLRG